MLDQLVWHEVCALLEEPQRLEQEYQRRLQAPDKGNENLTLIQAQVAKVRQGIARLIDSYAEGFIEKQEFEPRISRLRQRLTNLETQAQQIADEMARQVELRLIITRLEDFAAQVEGGIAEADWLTKRELIRTLVKRVEIGKEEVNVVFRVAPIPFDSSPDRGSLQHCRGRDHTSLRCSLFWIQEFVIFKNSRFEPSSDHIGNGPDGFEFGKQSVVLDVVEAFFDVGVQDIFRSTADEFEDRFNRIVCRPSWAKSIRVGFKLRFPFWFEG
jgi:hypothetical protein